MAVAVKATVMRIVINGRNLVISQTSLRNTSLVANQPAYSNKTISLIGDMGRTAVALIEHAKSINLLQFYSRH